MANRKISCCNCGSDSHDILTETSGNRGLDFIAQKQSIVVCKECGLVFINPQHDDNDYADYYKHFSRSTPVTLSSQEVLDKNKYRKIHANFLADTIAESDILNNLKLLDIGCGLGAFLHFCRELGFRVEGIEQSQTDIFR
jgi:transcription elongation factor Elf1